MYIRMEEKQKEEIRKEAQAILEKFAKTLDRVKVPTRKEGVKGEGTRVEGSGRECDSDFRKRLFENAPNKDEDCIIAEKASW